jgi:DNA primase
VNSPETPLFSKRRSLFGVDRAREAAFRGRAVIVVEGYLDVIALHQAGFDGAVAPLGTALTEDHLGELWSMTPEPLLCFDGDRAGEKAMERTIVAALPLCSTEKTIRTVQLSGGLDPDDFLQKKSAKTFEEVLASSLLLHEYLFSISRKGRNLSDPNQIAVWENIQEKWCDRAGSFEYKKFLRTYFREARRAHLGLLRAAERHSRTFKVPQLVWRNSGHFAYRRNLTSEQLVAEARIERARIFLAIIIRHTWLLDQADEAIGLADLPEGPATKLREVIVEWAHKMQRCENSDLMAYLEKLGFMNEVKWIFSVTASPVAAHAEALPGEVTKGFWHFFHALRDETDLIRDQHKAREELAATNNPAAQRRLMAVTDALAAVRRGEIAEEGDQADFAA